MDSYFNMLFFFCDSLRSGVYVDFKIEILSREAGDGYEESDIVYFDSYVG